jgi:hypothetical protein
MSLRFAVEYTVRLYALQQSPLMEAEPAAQAIARSVLTVTNIFSNNVKSNHHHGFPPPKTAT